MFADSQISTTTVKTVFSEEIAALSGQVKETFDDGRCIFVRSILPAVEEVRPQDRVQGGVALRSNGREICVHPYIFRQVCRNGAIMAESLGSQRIAAIGVRRPDEVLAELRAAVHDCAAPESFTLGVRQMRSSQHMAVDMALSLVSFLDRLPINVVSQFMRRLVEDGDLSAFGLANAITATARETTDPDLRWNLEELGGGVFANSTPQSPRRGSSAVRNPEFALAR